MADITIQSPIQNWLTKIESSRSELIAAAKSGSRVAAAFAMADARVSLIESLADEAIRARLLRMTDPAIAMVELANNPTDDDRIRICAIAILSGFCPGEEQFAIFGGGRNKDGSFKSGKLYTKEAGFRILFAHLGIVPEVHTTHPEYVAFGESGKKIWRVGGSASCVHNGADYDVTFEGDELIGIPGYESDNVAGVAAKARRRILQSLWSMVSPILTSDQADDTETISQTSSQPKLDTSGPVHVVTEAETYEKPKRTAAPKPDKEAPPVEYSKEQHAAEVGLLTQRGALAADALASDHDNLMRFTTTWDQIAATKTATQLKAVGDDIKAAGDRYGDSISVMRDWYAFRLKEITGKICITTRNTVE